MHGITILTPAYEPRYVPAEAMDRNAIDTLLREAAVGTLALADDGDSYAVPQSFGYDGEAIYFQCVSHETSRKMAFFETTGIATLTAVAENPWRSVIARGPLARVSETDQPIAANAIAENASIPTLNVTLDTPLSELAIDFYRLDPEQLSGRRFGGTAELDSNP